jgi:hypothetical protein
MDITNPGRVAKRMIAFAIVALFILTIVVWHRHAAWLERPIALPSDSDIGQMTASVMLPERVRKMSEEFIVPQNYVPRIMEVFRGAHATSDYESEPQILAVLKLRKTSGESVEITVPQVGQNRLEFTIDGVECVRGGDYCPVNVQPQGDGMYLMECDFVALALVKIYQEQRTNEPSDRIERIFEELERSLGKRPPRRYSNKNDASPLNPPAHP